MKKVFILIAITSFGYMSVNSQPRIFSGKSISKNKLSSIPLNINSITLNPKYTDSNILWSDDFSTPSNWIINHTAGTSNDWIIGTTAPSGQNPIGVINSTTAANNFALFDSDKLCSHDQVANLTTAIRINLTGHPNVRLSFQQFYKRYHDSTYIYISNNGNTWTRFEVNGDLRVNDYSSNDQSINPDYYNVNISSEAGDQDSVYVRFQFYSPDTNLTEADDLAGCAYSWMIDDIKISDIPFIDGEIMKVFCGEYTILPVLQTEGFALHGKFTNTGLDTISGAKIFFSVTDPFGNFYYDTSLASGTINPGDTSGYLNSTGTYVPLSLGQYLIEQKLFIAGDSDNTNNNSIGTVLVDDSSYARDYTAIDINDFRGSIGFHGATISIGQKFHIYQSSQFSSVSFYLNHPVLNDHVNVSAYSVDTSGMPDQFLGSTSSYLISVGDTTGNFFTLPFLSWINVTPGDYFISLNQLDSNDITLGISNHVYTPGSGFYNLNGAGWNPNENASLNLALMLRINNPSSTLVGIKNSPEKKSTFTIYPNPSNGIFYISSNFVEKNISIKIFNGLGQLIKTSFYHSFMNSSLVLNNFPVGIYSVKIQSDSGEENKKIVLE